MVRVRRPACTNEYCIACRSISFNTTSGCLVFRTKGVGDKVSAGDIIMVVESDKADMDVESFEDGYIAAILVDDGETAAVGSTVAILVPNEADIANVVVGGDAPAAAEPAAASPAEAAPAAGADLPDGAAPVFMPALSSTMTEGKIVQWTKSEGDKISAGDILMVVESDKADMDVESFEEGSVACCVSCLACLFALVISACIYRDKSWLEKAWKGSRSVHAIVEAGVEGVWSQHRSWCFLIPAS